MGDPLIRSANPLPLGLLGSDRLGRESHQSSGSSADFVGVLKRESFGLESKPSDIKFSSHALQRMESRGLELEPQELERLQRGMSSLRQKSVRDGLVVVGEHRFVVSAENKTVITVMASSDREVFTNIQGVAFE